MEEGTSLNGFKFKHLPVLSQEVVESIDNLPQAQLKKGLIIDATLGSGGHSALLLEKFPEINLIGIDQDPNARIAASKNLKNFGSRITIVEGNFANFVPPQKAIMVLADLGVSSPQLDDPSRGFSLKYKGRIDMRMNPQEGLTAAELIEQLNETELANIIFNYGEEKLSRKIARRIKLDLSEKGPYPNTTDLAYAIAGCYHPKLRYRRIHPATKTFQALRIAVNKELEVLDQLLTIAPDWLVSGGLLEIISFHSLEDRKVKNCLKSDERLEKITRKPIRASEKERSINRRSRSAKLRIGKRKT